jgi:hypothetical protein
MGEPVKQKRGLFVLPGFALGEEKDPYVFVIQSWLFYFKKTTFYINKCCSEKF